MDPKQTKFSQAVQVILPLAIDQTYSYGIPTDWLGKVKVGMRVEVQFGKRRTYGALVRHVLDGEFVQATKPIINVLDEEPIMDEVHFRFWEWMAEYYMCPIGAIMIAALPAGLKMNSETTIRLHPDFNGEEYPTLPPQEDLIVETLENRTELKLEEIRSLLGRKQVYRLIKSMLEREILLVSEELKNLYREKREFFVKLSAEFKEEQVQRDLFDQLEKRAPKQLQIFMSYLSLSRDGEFVKASQVVKKVEGTTAALNALVKKGVFEKQKIKVSRLDDKYDEIIIDFRLTEEQEVAKKNISEHLSQGKVALVHGVTSSGKTALYIELIKEQLAVGKTALFLLPEIALTSQMIHRLRKVFGSEVGIYHSRFNPHEKVEIWDKVKLGQYKLVVGARSALFLPFQNLGLIVIDEEHDPSYKQREPAPHYHARDALIYYGLKNKAQVIMGSATPAIDTYYNAQKGKFGLTELKTRYGGGTMPAIELIDIRAAKRKNKMSGRFSWDLLNAIKSTLEKGEQVIIFKNRRGYSPFVECEKCQWIPQCERCDVSLTYHKYSKDLKCHYCGFRISKPVSCASCGEEALKEQGFGTEKIEEELAELLPDVRIGRLDLETTRSRNSFNQLIDAFDGGDLKILVGTQMVTKGLDFINVGLVGILGADELMHFPDFRSTERAFQLMLQVSGRAGRRKEEARVLIQTHEPKNPLYKYVLQRDYRGFYEQTLSERQEWKYPPFKRFIHLRVKHRDQRIVNEASLWLVRNLQQHLGPRVLGPAPPAVSRVRNLFLRDILIKLPPKADYISQCKRWISEVIKHLRKTDPFKSVIVHADVDPVS